MFVGCSLVSQEQKNKKTKNTSGVTLEKPAKGMILADLVDIWRDRVNPSLVKTQRKAKKKTQKAWENKRKLRATNTSLVFLSCSFIWPLHRFDFLSPSPHTDATPPRPRQPGHPQAVGQAVLAEVFRIHWRPEFFILLLALDLRPSVHPAQSVPSNLGGSFGPLKASQKY